MTTALAVRRPRAPMSRLDVDALFRLRLDPSADNAPTRKDQRMRAGLVDHGELQIVFEWSIRDRSPHVLNSGQQFQSCLDLDHISPGSTAGRFDALIWIKTGPADFADVASDERSARYHPYLPALRDCHARH